MKTLGKRGLSGALEVTLCLLMVVALGLMISLPWSVTVITGRKAGETGGYYEKYLLVMYVSGMLAEVILWQGRGIMRNVNRNRPFVHDTVRRMRIIGIACLALALFYFIFMFFLTKFFMAVVCVAFTVIGLILFVFAELFRQATRFKEENDMTI